MWALMWGETLVELNLPNKIDVCWRRGWDSCPLATSRQRVAARLNPASTPRPSTARDWRRGWDSNPRALADKTLSRRPRYDHFGTSPDREPVRLPPSRSALRRPRKPDTTFDGGRCSARTTIPARTFHYTGRRRSRKNPWSIMRHDATKSTCGESLLPTGTRPELENVRPSRSTRRAGLVFRKPVRTIAGNLGFRDRSFRVFACPENRCFWNGMVSSSARGASAPRRSAVRR